MVHLDCECYAPDRCSPAAACCLAILRGAFTEDVCTLHSDVDSHTGCAPSPSPREQVCQKGMRAPADLFRQPENGSRPQPTRSLERTLKLVCGDKLSDGRCEPNHSAVITQPSRLSPVASPASPYNTQNTRPSPLC